MSRSEKWGEYMEMVDLKLMLKDEFDLKDGVRSFWIGRTWPKVNKSEEGVRVRYGESELLTLGKFKHQHHCIRRSHVLMKAKLSTF